MPASDTSPPWDPWQRLRLNRFVVLGRVGMDLYADPPATRVEEAKSFFAAIGGSAGNIAVALARQGSGAALLSRVSDDAVGRFCLAALSGYGVDTTHVGMTRNGARTSLAVTETVAPRAETVLYRNNAADFCLTSEDAAAPRYGKIAALVVTGTALAADPSREAVGTAIALARKAGALVVLDVDYRAYSWASEAEAARICRAATEAADIVVANDEEWGLLAGDLDKGRAVAESLARDGALFTVYKRGALGSVTFTPEGSFETPIFPVTALKPMGAGDGFMGGLLAGLAQGRPLPEATRRGAATAAMIVTGIGCAPASPDTAELDRFLTP